MPTHIYHPYTHRHTLHILLSGLLFKLFLLLQRSFSCLWLQVRENFPTAPATRAIISPKVLVVSMNKTIASSLPHIRHTLMGVCDLQE